MPIVAGEKMITPEEKAHLHNLWFVKKEHRGKGGGLDVAALSKLSKPERAYVIDEYKKEDAEKKEKTAFPLVSREEYVRNLKVLSIYLLGRKGSKKDYEEGRKISGNIFSDDPVGESRRIAFIHSLASIYKEATDPKEKSKFNHLPVELRWSDYFDARKSEYEGYSVLSNNARPDQLGKYFNLYNSSSGTDTAFGWSHIQPGFGYVPHMTVYFFGFKE
jgi:hypothetical protein